MTSQTTIPGLNKVQPSNSATEKPLEGLRKLFIEELKDIYWAEKALSSALPKIVDGASSEELADEILDHLALTLNHITRLEVVFSSLNIKPEATRCETMAGLVREAGLVMSESDNDKLMDMGILSVIKKMQHYKITSYGILCSFSKALGEIKVLSLLENILIEEREIYVSMVNLVEALSSNIRQEETWRLFELKQRA